LFSVSQFSFEEGELVISSLLWVGSAFSLPVSQYQTFAALQKVGKVGSFLPLAARKLNGRFEI